MDLKVMTKCETERIPKRKREGIFVLCGINCATVDCACGSNAGKKDVLEISFDTGTEVEKPKSLMV
jgi:hypothetical protein